MSSKIIQNYYTIKEEKEDRIIKGYKDLLLILSIKQQEIPSLRILFI